MTYKQTLAEGFLRALVGRTAAFINPKGAQKNIVLYSVTRLEAQRGDFKLKIAK